MSKMNNEKPSPCVECQCDSQYKYKNIYFVFYYGKVSKL